MKEPRYMYFLVKNFFNTPIHTTDGIAMGEDNCGRKEWYRNTNVDGRDRPRFGIVETELDEDVEVFLKGQDVKEGWLIIRKRRSLLSSRLVK